MNNVAIAETFDLLADLLEFQDANPFRVRAYRNAARTIRDFPEPMEAILASGDRKLTDIAGIGKDMAEKIATLSGTGKLPLLEELQAQVPGTVLALLRIPGLGPKKAAALFRELNVTTLDELRAACEEHKVRDLKGFAAKTEEAILAGISLASSHGERLLWADADVYAQTIREHLCSSKAVEQIEIAGSYRRGKETIGDLDFLVVATDVRAVMDCFGRYADVADVVARGPTKMSVRLQHGLQVDLRVVPAESFGAALVYFTG
jgi:DNA polymerase (family 10)